MRSSITFTTLLSLVLLVGTGCDSEPSTELRSGEIEAGSAAESSKPAKSVESVTALEPAKMAPSARTVIESNLPSPPSSSPAAISGAWQSWLDAEVGRVQAEAPQWFEHVMTVEPRRARSGYWRLVGPELEDPNVTPVLLHRYLTRGESPEVRAAVIAALVGLDGGHAKLLGELLGNEPDPLVRIGMVSTLRRVPGPEAIATLELALADADPEVRVTAATTAGRHPEGASLAVPLIAALADTPAVALAASRSLGYLKVPSATSALTGLLGSSDPDLRLASLQAIDRIDPSHAEGLSLLATLAADADPKVAAAAQRIASR